MRYSSLALLPLAAASPFKVGTIHNDAAPVLSSTTAEEVVPNSYIVVLKKDVKDAKKHHEWVQSVHTKAQDERMELRKRSQFPITTDIFEGLKHTYDIVGGLVGYSGHFDDETLEQIRRHPDVSTLLSPSPEHLPGWRKAALVAYCMAGCWGGISFRAAASPVRQQAARGHAIQRNHT